MPMRGSLPRRWKDSCWRQILLFVACLVMTISRPWPLRSAVPPMRCMSMARIGMICWPSCSARPRKGCAVMSRCDTRTEQPSGPVSRCASPAAMARIGPCYWKVSWSTLQKANNTRPVWNIWLTMMKPPDCITAVTSFRRWSPYSNGDTLRRVPITSALSTSITSR